MDGTTAGLQHAGPDAPGFGSRAEAPLVIGLVNAMPGAAHGHTENQFRAILPAAAGRGGVDLRCVALHGGPARSGTTIGMAMLERDPPDGLIVTGMPARAGCLADEPYWQELTELVDFATRHGIPAVWLCLAAHAAVLHLDGIERCRLPQKLVGLAECVQTDPGHPMMLGLPDRWAVPHSRHNEVPEDALRAHGYRILSRAADAGVDIFARDAGAAFLFCQGHPEYDAQALLREYRRDIRAFLAGECEDYPAMPQGSFSPELAHRLDEFRGHATARRATDIMAGFPTEACVAELRHTWHDLARGLYANWLAGVAVRKACRESQAGQPAGAIWE